MDTILHGEDTIIKLKIKDSNGEPFNMKDRTWDICITNAHGRGYSLNIHRECTGEYENNGKIKANMEVENNEIILYVKHSKNSFSPGLLQAQLSLYDNDIKFEDGIKIIKSNIKDLTIWKI
jgi:hypothetical protein